MNPFSSLTFYDLKIFSKFGKNYKSKIVASFKVVSGRR
jgi:hypothetical protein